MNIFIYGLVDPRDGEIYYVGQSKDPTERFKQHLADVRDTPKVKWLCELKSFGLQPNLEILETSNTKEWSDREKHWIQKGVEEDWPLTNLTGGGEGQLRDNKVDHILGKFFDGFGLNIDTEIIIALEYEDKFNLVLKLSRVSTPHLRGLLNEFGLQWKSKYGIEYTDIGLYYDEEHCRTDLEYCIYEFLASKGPLPSLP